MPHLETQDLEPSEVAFGGADAHRMLEPVSWSKVRVPPVQSPAKTPGGKCRGNLDVPLEVRINGFFSPLPLLICREYILVMGVYLGEITHCSVLTIDPITSNGTIQVGELVVFREMIHHFCAFGDFSGCWLVGDVAVLGGPGGFGEMLLLFFLEGVVFFGVWFANHQIRRWMFVFCCSVWILAGNKKNIERIEAKS